METKRIEFKQADGCEFIARIAMIGGPPDADNDIIEPGAFRNARKVAVLPAHDNQHHPIGFARIEERGTEALAIGEFNTGTEAGRDWCSTLKFDLEDGQPIQEWSFGFFVRDFFVDDDGVRHLTDLDVMEVSPVLRGAGVNTGTQCTGSCGGKSAKGAECSCGCSGPSEDELVEQWAAEMAKRHREHLAKERRNQPSELAIRGIESLGGEPRKSAWRYTALPPEDWMQEAVVEAADRLRIDPPAVFLMRQTVGDEKADIATDHSIDGASMDYGDEGQAIFIREAIPLRNQMEALGHELKHLEFAVKGRQPRTHDAVEYECDRYGFRFAEALAVGSPMPTSRPGSC